MTTISRKSLGISLQDYVNIIKLLIQMDEAQKILKTFLPPPPQKKKEKKEKFYAFSFVAAC